MEELGADSWLEQSAPATCERIIRQHFGERYTFLEWQPTMARARVAVFTDRDFGLEWVLAPAGAFWFGLTDAEQEAALTLAPNPLLDLGEMRPVHRMEVTPFLISAAPLTQADAVRCSVNVDGAVGPLQAALFTQEQSRQAAAGFGALLPTEAQWEYACRAGTQSLFWFGDEIPGNEQMARILGLEQPMQSNYFGLRSLFFGEWCSDLWRRNHDAESVEDPGSGRVIKGGAARFWPWHDSREWSGCVSAFRMPSIDTGGAGAAVRLVRQLP